MCAWWSLWFLPQKISRTTLSSAEPGLSPGHSATHIFISRVFKNIEGDVSCGRKCVAALIEAGGLARGERIPSFFGLNKAPTCGLRGMAGVDMGFQHFLYFYFIFYLYPLFSHLPLQGVLEAKTDTCQDVRCPDKIRMILSKAGMEGNQL